MTLYSYTHLVAQQPIRVEDLTAYLARRGWHREADKHGRYLVFVGPTADDGTAITMIVPQANDRDDSSLRLTEALEQLSAVEDRPLDELVQAIRSLDKDVLRIRVLTGSNESGSLSFDVAMGLLQGLRDFLSATAVNEENPRPYFAKASAAGRHYLERCRFGQTFSGSFGLTIESPVTLTSPSSLSVKEIATSFERRVMLRVARALASAQDAVLSGDVAPLASNFLYGLNANMCDAILEIPHEIRETETEYTIIWSPELKTPDDLPIGSPIRLGPKSYSYLEAAARMLHVEQSKDVIVRGRVVQLRSETAPLDEDEDVSGERVITILWEQDDAPQMRVRVSLDAASYKVACDAHKEGRVVSVKGKLEKQGKFWTLMSPHNFTKE